MNFLKETFNEYSALDGEKGLMSKKEFAKLLRTQEGIVSKKNQYFIKTQHFCLREL